MTTVINKEDNIAALESLIFASSMDDNPKELSEAEDLALRTVAEKYEGADFAGLALTEPDLLFKIREEVSQLHAVLNGRAPQEQVIYLDFSELETFYNENFKDDTQLDFAKFKKIIAKKIPTYFEIPKGKLNIRWVLEKPEGTSFTRVFFSPRSLAENLKEDPDIAIAYVGYIMGLANFFPEMTTQDPTLKALSNYKARYPYDNEAQVIDRFVREYRFRAPTNWGMTLTNQGVDLGNQSANDLVLIDGKNFLDTLESSTQQLDKGDSTPRHFLTPWVAKNPKRNLATAMAETAAHEIAHALGLNHNSEAYRRYLAKNRSSTQPSPVVSSPNIMTHPWYLFKAGFTPGTLKFSDDVLKYFKFILGSK